MPGDKSISHRAAMIAALADGGSRISNFSTGADCAATLSCLAQLGVGITRIANELLVASAQVKSCILLAGLNANGRTKVTENFTTRDHSERMLRWFGIPVETSAGEREDSRTSAVGGPVHFTAREVSVPGDISSAGYFIAAAALLPDSSIEITNVGVNPTRTLYLEQLRAWGFDIEIGNTRDKSK